MTISVEPNTLSISAPLLSDGELPPYEIINESGKAKCVIICDHAGVNVPKKLNRLGLEDYRFGEHYAQDVGSRQVSITLSNLLDAPCILANYSRLVVDLNRRLDHPTAFVTNTEHGPVPGNVNMKDDEKNLRVNEIYIPYHVALEKLIRSYTDKGIIPAIISIHSFTPMFYKQKRPWELGLLWVQDQRLPEPIINYFRNLGYVVGDNEPYDARILRGTTINHHADANGLPNALFEIRNDLVRSEEACVKWGEMIAACMNEILDDESIHSIYDGPQFIHDPDLDVRYFEELIEKAKRGEA
jgi:predicted N-formylglutamate amidohydrolase